MKNISKLLWGLGFIVVGLIIALNQLGFTNINIFFRGWWTLFIIIPSLVSMFVSKENVFTNFIVFLIGTALLLTSRGLISFELIMSLLFPTILVLIGLSILFGSKIKGDKNKEFISASDDGALVIATSFSEKSVKYTKDQSFTSAKLDAVFGEIKFSLVSAKLGNVSHIKTSAIFAGIKIFVSDDVNVIIRETNIFGGTTNKVLNARSNKKTIYIDSFCLFGGLKVS